MRHWIAAARGAGPQALIGGVALLGHILALSLLPGGFDLSETRLFAIGVGAIGLAAVLGLRRETAFSIWFDVPCLAYAGAVALSAHLAPSGSYVHASRDAMWFSALAMATWRVALDARVRAAAVAAIVASLAVLLAAALGPRSNPDPFGRFLYYPALGHWGAYPEIGLLACMGAGAAIAIALAARPARPLVKPMWSLRSAATMLAVLFALVPVLVLSRGAIAAVGGLGVWLVLVAAIKWRERLVVAALVVGGLTAGAIAWRYLDLARIQHEYGQTAAAYAVGERASAWIAGREMVRDHPLIGVGPGRYIVEFPNYRTDVAPMRHAHNMLLNVAAETGLLALIPFTLFWARMLLAPLWTRGSTRAAIVAFATYGMIAAFFIRNLTDHFLSNVHSSLRMSLFVAVVLGLAEASIRDARRSPRNPDS